MPDKKGSVGGFGARRTGHRFVVVVYGEDAAAEQPWPGHVVYVPATVDTAPEVRVPFEQVERLPGVLRELLCETRPIGPAPRRARH
jgi:hypothetical protein